MEEKMFFVKVRPNEGNVVYDIRKFEYIEPKEYYKIVITNIPSCINDSYMLNNVIKNICPNIEPISFILEENTTGNTQSAHIVVEDETNTTRLKSGINDKPIQDEGQRLEFYLNASTNDWARENLTLDGVRQFFVDVMTNEYKCLTLIDIVHLIPNRKIVIYTNTIEIIDFLQHELNMQGLKTLAYHEGIEISQREFFLHQFRVEDFNIIIATDCINSFLEREIASVQICYEFPPSPKQYLQRFGRSGCYGRKGFVIILCNKSEMIRLKDTKEYFKTVIDELSNDFQYYC